MRRLSARHHARVKLRDNSQEQDTTTDTQLRWVDDRTVQVHAGAKLNLTLAVGAERPDGYHSFESLMTTVTLCDEVVIRRAKPGIRIKCNDSAVPVDSRNLIYRAASLLAWYGKVSPAVELDLEKRIPTQAGLGGASSDAAASLIGLNAMWDLQLPIGKLHEIASVLGSDVAFFLSGPLAVCKGRGEQVYPLGHDWKFWAVIVQPADRLATDRVYRYHRVSDASCFGAADALAKLLVDGKASEVSEHFRNATTLNRRRSG